MSVPPLLEKLGVPPGVKIPPDRPLFPEVKRTERGKSHGLQTCKTQVWIKRCGWMQGGCWWWMKLGLVAVQALLSELLAKLLLSWRACSPSQSCASG